MLTHHITLKSYDELADTFACEVTDTVDGKPISAGGAWDCTIPAFLMPVIAQSVVDACCEEENADDYDGPGVPFALVGKAFTVSVS